MPLVVTTCQRLVLGRSAGLLRRLSPALRTHRLVGVAAVEQSPVLLFHIFDLVAFADLYLSDRLSEVEDVLAVSFVQIARVAAVSVTLYLFCGRLRAGSCPCSSEAHDTQDFVLVDLSLAALVEFQAALSTHIPYLRPALLDEVQELPLRLIQVLSWNL